MANQKTNYTNLRTPVRRFGPFPYGENEFGEALVLIKETPYVYNWDFIPENERLWFYLAKHWVFATQRNRNDIFNRSLQHIVGRLSN